MTTAALMPAPSGPVQPHAPHHSHAAGIPLFGRSRSGSFLVSSSRYLSVFGRERNRASASLQRVHSEADLVGLRAHRAGTAKAQEEYQEVLALEREDTHGLTRVWSGTGLAVPGEELPVGGVGIGGIGGGGGGGGGRGGRKGGREGTGGGQSEIGAYYKEMLESDPGNPLLLRNYGKFLHEVEGDMTGAEECYGRAILASPGDGEVLSLYGKLIWDAHRDETRAEAYFERAVEASPDDCYVLGSYAHFLWDTEEEEENTLSSATSPSPQQQPPPPPQQQQLVKAY